MANEFLLAAMRLQTKGQLRLHDAVFVHRDEAGRSTVRETQDISTGRGALGAGMWGLLLGTLFGGPIAGLIGGAASAGGGARLAHLVGAGTKGEKNAAPAGS